MVEYGLLVGLIAVGAISSVLTLGGNISTVFTDTASAIRVAQDNVASTPKDNARVVRRTFGFLSMTTPAQSLRVLSSTGNAALVFQGESTNLATGAAGSLTIVGDLPSQACRINTVSIGYQDPAVPSTNATIVIAWSGNDHYRIQSHTYDNGTPLPLPNGQASWTSMDIGQNVPTLAGC